MLSRRNTLTATAVMTWHVLVLSSMALQTVQASQVYRCTGPQGHVTYQARPCTASASSTTALRQQPLKVADARTDDQLRQALDNRRREGFDTPRVHAAKAASRRPKGKVATASGQAQIARPARERQAERRARQPQAPATNRAGALTSHRFGERPFEHAGTPLSDAAPRRKVHGRGKEEAHGQRNAKRAKDFTARAPADERRGRVRVQN